MPIASNGNFHNKILLSLPSEKKVKGPIMRFKTAYGMRDRTPINDNKTKSAFGMRLASGDDPKIVAGVATAVPRSLRQPRAH